MRFEGFRSAGIKTCSWRRAGWYPISNNKKGGILGDILLEIVATILAILLVGALFAFPVMWVWNAVIPSIFDNRIWTGYGTDYSCQVAFL